MASAGFIPPVNFMRDSLAVPGSESLAHSMLVTWSPTILPEKELSLLVSQDWARKLNALPLTHRRTVYPAYIAELYGVKAIRVTD